MTNLPSADRTALPLLPQRLWDDPARAHLALGCTTCSSFALCGGLCTESDMWDCLTLCCGDPTRCDLVCPKAPTRFVRRKREVDTFDLGNVPRTPVPTIPVLPTVVPFVGRRYRRQRVLMEAAVALSLYELVNRSTESVRFKDRLTLAKHFGIQPDATIVATGVDRDVRVEGWWKLRNREEILGRLRELGIALVTVPNFSLLTDVPRHDNLHAIKRIALAWAELQNAGVASALHINARNPQDYVRWSDFVQACPEVRAIAFEFATGAASPRRGEWHVRHLCGLADAAGRSLTLVVRGGKRYLRVLREHFAHVVLIDTEAYMRTVKRRRGFVTSGGRLRWAPAPTPRGASLDTLFTENIRAVRRSIADLTTQAKSA